MPLLIEKTRNIYFLFACYLITNLLIYFDFEISILILRQYLLMLNCNEGPQIRSILGGKS